MALQLHRSNRSERLVDALAEVVRRPLRDPLAPELIAVQSKGMERWLAFELSARLGVLANAELPFPRHLLSRLFDAVLREDAALAEPFAEQALTFSIASVVASRLGEPAFAPLAAYLADDREHAMLLQLSARLARVLDDYAVYRPELLAGFERGEVGEPAFEAEIVRALVQRHGPQHQAARVERLIAALERGELEDAALPERVCVFGVASLPPLYLRALSALARRVETHLFVLTPSHAYLGDQRRQAHPRPADGEGHPLLVSLGRLGRDLQGLLEQDPQYVERGPSAFEDPGRGCLLHALQSDMLALDDRGGPDGSERLAISADDASLAIHVCHGPMREVEVLHDQLVEILEQGEVEPHQIVVMTPDIERYAPIVEAVFGAETGRARIPFSVADRKPRASFEVVHALSLLLDALRSRFHASTLLDLLAVPSIGARAGIVPGDLDTLRAWVEGAGARLGMDAAHRSELGLPGTSLHTWRYALDRLLLGLALEPRPERLYAGVSPVEGGHGSESELVGKLAAFCERLFVARERVSAAQGMRAWSETLGAVLGELVAATPVTAGEHALVQAALATLVRDAERAGFDAPLGLASVWSLLEERLDVRMPARGLLARGVTFCQLVPMRSIPFEVVCLLGLNDGDLPRASVPLAFDRRAAHGASRPGDRSPRDDDRHMVLEAILCARRRLLLSYVGLGIDDNRVRPPSVVVSELIDAVDRGFFPAGRESNEPAGPDRRASLVARLCVEHKLHAFSAHYFDRSQPRLFSYSRPACEAARTLAERVLGEETAPELSAPELPLCELEVDELVRWVSRPLASFAERRLGLYLRDDPAPAQDREPFELRGLGRWQQGAELLGMRLRGVPLAAACAALKVSGGLPHGTPGDIALERLAECVEGLVAQAQAARGGARLPPVLVSLELDGVALRGALYDVFPRAQVVTSFSREGRRMELECYVRHVVLNAHLAAAGATAAVRSVVVCPDEEDIARTVGFAPPADPRRALVDLFALCRDARSAALPFEHNVSRAYAETHREQVEAAKPEKAHDAALRAAAKAFDADRRWMSPYLERFFPTFEVLAAERTLDFTQVARRTFDALLASRSVL